MATFASPFCFFFCRQWWKRYHTVKKRRSCYVFNVGVREFSAGRANCSTMGTPRQDNHSSSAIKPVIKPYGRIVLSLKNCLLPENKLCPTPSQNDGLDQETETDLRILGCELIQTAGILLKLPQVSMIV